MTAPFKPRAKPARLIISHAMQELLHALGDAPADARSLADLTVFLARPDPAVMKLWRHGYLVRERRHDPPNPAKPTLNRVVRWWYYRSRAGRELLEELMGREYTASWHQVVLESDCPLLDDDGLLADHNRQRGSLTFKATMHAFQIADITDFYRLALPKRRAFEAAWTRAMYDACAAAGTPIIVDRQPHDQYRAKHAARTRDPADDLLDEPLDEPLDEL